MLVFNNINYSIEGKSILSNASWHVEPGVFTVVLGPNGAGKSSLLKILSGEVQRSGGDLLLDNKPIESWAPNELAKIRAVLPQSFDLNFDFSVKEVVMMGRYPHITASESLADYDICEKALHKVGLAQFADRPYRSLSGGERQRVHLARVLVQIWPDEVHTGAQYMFLDEPTSNLDLAQQHKALNTAHALKYRNTGVFVVLHDLNLAMKYADEAILMQGGQVVKAGDVHEVLKPSILEEVYRVKVTLLENPFDEERPLIITAPR